MNTSTQPRRGRGGSTVNRQRTHTRSSQSRNSASRYATSNSRRPNSGGGFRRGRSSAGGGNRGRGGRGGAKMPTFDPSRFINTNPVDATEEVYNATHTFGDFGLDSRLVQAIAAAGMEIPTPIQDQIIPEILNGRDVIGFAQTGTGKTAAFLVPLIQKTLGDRTRQTLILVPTRELALQIEAEFRKLSRGFGLYSVICVGGINIRPQINTLRRQNHFIIGTPGRVLDLLNRGNFKPTRINTVVLDEADRMLDMGFINDIRSIVGATPKERETLFFSATMAKDSEKLVNAFLRNPVTVSVKKKDVTNSIEQDVVPFVSERKFETLTSLLAKPEFSRVLVFGAMKHSVKKLAQDLTRSNVQAESIHGNKTHGQRQNALNKFKSGHARVLVATDVAARGIHVDNVSHVINYDLPNTFEDYVHRIGRTGRGVNKGKALTFIPNKR